MTSRPANRASRARRRCRAGAALAIGFVLAELLLRGLLLWPGAEELLRQQETGSWRRRWAAVRRGSRPAHPMLITDRYDPVIGWRPRPNLDIDVSGAHITTNAQGFRSLHDFSPRPSAGRARVLAIGDSFTFGEEVGDQEAWPYLLGRRRPDIEVLNLGVHGYGHDQMLLLLREVGLSLHPDVVILGFVALDLWRNTLRFRDAAKPHFTVVEGALALEQPRVPTPEAVLAAEPWQLRLIDLAAMLRFQFRLRTGAHAEQMQHLARALLTAIAEESIAAGATPVFAYLPTGDDLSAVEREGADERFLLDACESIHIKHPTLVCGSTRQAFAAAAAEGAVQHPVGHWDARGQAAAASGVEAVLVAGHVVPAVSRGSNP